MNCNRIGIPYYAVLLSDWKEVAKEVEEGRTEIANIKEKGLKREGWKLVFVGFLCFLGGLIGGFWWVLVRLGCGLEVLGKCLESGQKGRKLVNLTKQAFWLFLKYFSQFKS